MWHVLGPQLTRMHLFPRYFCDDEKLHPKNVWCILRCGRRKNDDPGVHARDPVALKVAEDKTSVDFAIMAPSLKACSFFLRLD